MKSVTARMAGPPFYPEVWPGEHYKLLAALVMEIAPRTVIEIGTFKGTSALAMLQTLSPDSTLYTFDLVPWNQFPDSCLRNEDFGDGRLKQVIGDLGKPDFIKQHREIFRNAELIFMDGPKDGVFEQKLLDYLYELPPAKSRLLVLDDIRVWNMLATWRQIRKPKLDLTSFGHWSGTGLVLWS